MKMIKVAANNDLVFIVSSSVVGHVPEPRGVRPAIHRIELIASMLLSAQRWSVQLSFG
jgi:hypothetical protein